MRSRLELFIALAGVIIAFIGVTITLLNWVHPFNPVGPSPFQRTGSAKVDETTTIPQSPRTNAQQESKGGLPTAQSGSGNSSVVTSPKNYIEPMTGMEFVWLPAGCFNMGCGAWTAECDDDEMPIHMVCVDGFWMGKTEVTQGQWKTIMGASPPAFIGDQYPVEWVSWYQTQEFLRRLKEYTKGKFEFRLPTEAEWEYACRSGGQSEKYAGSSNVAQVAWYRSNSGNALHPVSLKSPNSVGLYDMSGNVAEWCEDAYDHDAFRKHQQAPTR